MRPYNAPVTFRLPCSTGGNGSRGRTAVRPYGAVCPHDDTPSPWESGSGMGRVKGTRALEEGNTSADVCTLVSPLSAMCYVPSTNHYVRR
ncbi:hypothetical protein HRbin30_02051 [bacterium HR30]|nr:hypothetical protein HRbin30_02051 [bacterium HR30]